MFRFVFAVGGNTEVRLVLLLSVAVLQVYLLNLHSVVSSFYLEREYNLGKATLGHSVY
jgi:hypothetical protein